MRGLPPLWSRGQPQAVARDSLGQFGSKGREGRLSHARLLVYILAHLSIWCLSVYLLFTASMRTGEREGGMHSPPPPPPHTKDYEEINKYIPKRDIVLESQDKCIAR